MYIRQGQCISVQFTSQYSFQAYSIYFIFAYFTCSVHLNTNHIVLCIILFFDIGFCAQYQTCDQYTPVPSQQQTIVGPYYLRTRFHYYLFLLTFYSSVSQGLLQHLIFLQRLSTSQLDISTLQFVSNTLVAILILVSIQTFITISSILAFTQYFIYIQIQYSSVYSVPQVILGLLIDLGTILCPRYRLGSSQTWYQSIRFKISLSV